MRLGDSSSNQPRVKQTCHAPACEEEGRASHTRGEGKCAGAPAARGHPINVALCSTSKWYLQQQLPLGAPLQPGGCTRCPWWGCQPPSGCCMANCKTRRGVAVACPLPPHTHTYTSTPNAAKLHTT